MVVIVFRSCRYHFNWLAGVRIYGSGVLVTNSGNVVYNWKQCWKRRKTHTLRTKLLWHVVLVNNCLFPPFRLGDNNHKTQMIPSARKPTVWTLRKVSTRFSLRMPRRLTRTGTFHLLWIFCFGNYCAIPLSPWLGLCRLTWVDTLRRSHSVGFLVGTAQMKNQYSSDYAFFWCTCTCWVITNLVYILEIENLWSSGSY